VSFATLWERFESDEVLEQRLREIARTHSGDLYPGVHLIDAAGNCLAVGMSDRGWLLIHDDAAHTNMHFSAGGDESGDKLSFLFEEASSLPVRHLIPVPEAVEVIRMWCKTGNLSDSITWESHPY
jgi:hypothetical protein